MRGGGRRARLVAARERAIRAGSLVADSPVVQRVRAPLSAYGIVNGSVLAAGLAFLALFAVISGLLLLISVLVLLGDTEARRDEAVLWLIGQVPPVEAFAREIISGLADGARVGTVVGLIAFAWGASGFYVGLHDSLDVLLPPRRRRNALIARIEGIAAILLLVGAFVAAVAAASLGVVRQVAALAVGMDLGFLGLLVGPAIGIGGATLASLVVYRFVPSDPPSIREAALPALGSGVAIGLLTGLFGLVAPVLVGGFAGLGVIASVFVALVWFHWVFRFVLYGAAEARVRRDAARTLASPVGEAAG
ncbi:MAG: YhjD/YihY/BrkB family envelope integrity protein [Chloroflexota bacterium]